MAADKVQRLSGTYLRFRRCAEKKIAVSGNTGLFQRFESHSRCREVNAFIQAVENVLITGLNAEFQHYAAAGFQCPTKILIRQMLGDAGKAVPGFARRLLGQRF